MPIHRKSWKNRWSSFSLGRARNCRKGLWHRKPRGKAWLLVAIVIQQYFLQKRLAMSEALYFCAWFLFPGRILFQEFVGDRNRPGDGMFDGQPRTDREIQFLLRGTQGSFDLLR